MVNPLEHCLNFKNISANDPSLKQRPLKEAMQETTQKTQALMEKVASRIQAARLAREVKMYPRNGKMWITLESEDARRKVDQVMQEVVGDEQQILKSLPSTEEKPRDEDEGDQSKTVESGVAA